MTSGEVEPQHRLMNYFTTEAFALKTSRFSLYSTLRIEVDLYKKIGFVSIDKRCPN